MFRVRGDEFMLKDYSSAFIKSYLLLVLILIIGFLAIPVAGDPDIFEIINLKAHADKEYFINDTIRLEYVLNCTGGSGTENRKFILKLDDSFDFVNSTRYMPDVKYPDKVGTQTKKFAFEYDRRPDRSIVFKKLVVYLYNVNSDPNSIKETRITCNITPILKKCKTNHTYDLTDYCFISLVPSCNNRSPCKIKILNADPEILEFNISFNKSSGTHQVQFQIRDNDSHNLSWDLLKDDDKYLTYSTRGNPPLFNRTVLPDVLIKAEPQAISLSLHIWDNDGGENWSTKWTPIDSDLDYTYFGIFALLIIMILFFISYTKASPIGQIVSAITSIMIILIHILYFKSDFILLLISLLIALLLFNYALSFFSNVIPVPNDRINSENALSSTSINPPQTKNENHENCSSQSRIDGAVLRTYNSLCAAMPSWSASPKTWAFGFSFLWMALVIEIIIFSSSRIHVHNEFNYSNTIGLVFGLFALLLPNFIYKVRKCERIIFWILEFVILLAWIEALLYTIKSFNVKPFSDIDSMVFIFIITFVSLILLPLHISFYLRALKPKKADG